MRKEWTIRAWGIQLVWSAKSLDGAKKLLAGCANVKRPPELAKAVCYMFATRKAARDHINKEWGYIKTRQDLREYPHGWLMPRPVRITVSITEDRPA